MGAIHKHVNRRSCFDPGSVLSQLDLDFSAFGTRFRIFPQSPLLTDYGEPETIWISLPPSMIRPGPGDARMYVTDAIGKRPYEDPFLPPWRGARHVPARAGVDGHFDHLEVGTHQFESAHMYATLRWVLDIWQVYLGHEIDWSFREHYRRLELVPWLDWDNAHAGYGFIETGYSRDDQGNKFPFNLNFDVLAHEFGHTMLYSVIGMPDDDRATAEYFAFHETSGDMVAIVSVLHFDSVLERLLEQTRGNLYQRNELNRLGEESNTRQIRMASNDLKMKNVPDPATPLDEISIKQLHDMSLPMTGALFDLLVEIFQQNLLEAGLIPAELDRMSRGLAEAGNDTDTIQWMFDQAFKGDPNGFKKALVDARDYTGLLLARVWESLSWDLDFPAVVDALFRADQELTGGHYGVEITEVLEWREIPGIAPFQISRHPDRFYDRV